jgi:hypothetical protein
LKGFGSFSKANFNGKIAKLLPNCARMLAEVLETITPEVISSLTCYDFILEALFSAAS